MFSFTYPSETCFYYLKLGFQSLFILVHLAHFKCWVVVPLSLDFICIFIPIVFIVHTLMDIYVIYFFFLCYYEQWGSGHSCTFLCAILKEELYNLHFSNYFRVEILCNICLPFYFPLLWVVVSASFPSGFQNWFVEILVYSLK